MAIKVCTSSIFESNFPQSDRLSIQCALFHGIDQLLNPHQIYDSLEKDEDYRVDLPEFKLAPGCRDIESVVYLVKNGMFEPLEEQIARQLLKRECWKQLLLTLNREKWGDLDSDGRYNNNYRPFLDRMVQRMLARDIYRITAIVPKPPAPWIRERARAAAG
jgi:hypothetical protein